MQDIELILRCQKGDKQAFHDLIALYYPYVTKFLLGLTQNPHLSEDLTQDTFIRLIRGMDHYHLNDKSSFATYVMTIAKNLYIDHLRKAKNIRQEQLDEALPSAANMEDTIINRIDHESVAALLQTLPPEQAAAIHLKYMEQLTLVEIADRVGCEPKTIKSRIHNGMTRLRQKLII